MRSGLVKLLDHLCSLVDTNKPLDVGGAADESIHRVTSLSWASFQVLAEQCVSWENQDTTLSSGLAQQVRPTSSVVHVSIYRHACVIDVSKFISTCTVCSVKVTNSMSLLSI